MTDSKALIERLREQAWTITHMEAADHIENLEADNARLREALGEIWEWIGNWSPDFIWDDEWPATEAKARAALQETSQC